jgi:hypothetical protein
VHVEYDPVHSLLGWSKKKNDRADGKVACLLASEKLLKID